MPLEKITPFFKGFWETVMNSLGLAH